MSLSSLIVQRGVATMRQVEEALARQVIYGGDLVTNLLEVARVDEALLTRLLAESMRLPAAPSGMLPEVPARVRALVAVQFAVERGVVPLEQTGERRLVVVVAEPLPHDVEKQLTLSLGMTLEQRAAPLVRVLQAVAKTYGVPLDRRMQRLVGRLSGEPTQRGTPLPSSLTPLPPIAETPAPVPVAEAVTVTSEPPRSLGFDALPGRTGTPAFGMPVSRFPERVMPMPLVRRKTSTSFPAARLATDALPPMAPVSVAPPVEPSGAPADRVTPSVQPAPRPPSVPPSARPASVPPAARTSSVPPPRRASSERPGGLIKRDATPGPRAGRRRRGPLTADTARREAEEASDRDTLLDLFFEYSRQFFDYAAVFLLHGDIAEGRDAFGEGAPRDRVLGIGVPLDLPSLLSDAKEKRLPLVARARPDGLDAVLLGDLGRARDIEVAVVPLVVRTRAVAILVADCGEAGVDRQSLKEAAAFSNVVGGAFERIIVRRKLDGFVPGSREEAVGRVTAGLLASKRAVGTAAFTKVRGPAPQGEVATPELAPEAETVVAAPAPAHATAPPPTPALSPATSQAAHTVDTVRPPSRRPGNLTSTLPPPASNIAAMRKLSGPPIPREEPSSVSLGRVVSRGSPRSGPPRVRSGPPPPVQEDVPVVSDADAAQALFAELGWATTASPSGAEPEPASSGAISVPPHRPPSPVVAGPSDSLPSVILNVDGELRSLVDRLVAGGLAGYGDPAEQVPHGQEVAAAAAELAAQAERAEGELLRLGERAMYAIMERFPGPVAFTRERIAVMGAPPRASDSGPLLRLIVRQRRVALPFVLERLTSSDPDVRGWATHLLCELPYVDAIAHLLPRLGDDEASVRASAVLALRAIARVGSDAVRDALVELVHAIGPGQRLAAIFAMGRVRDAGFVPELVRALGDGEDRVVEAAHQALGEITRQDLGTDARPWLKWWEQNGTRHRVEWLIDALTHDVTTVRRAAGDELRAVTREYFGYSSDLPQRDRERAQQRYRDWWLMEGRARFQGG